MELRFWAATHTGRVRNLNEDNFLVDKRLQLFIVCDGMGGHAAGEVASAICVRTVRDVIASETELLARVREDSDDPVLGQAVLDLLDRAIRTACTRIFEMAQQDPSRRGMGTTCTALVLAGDRGFVGYVGDTRIYRLRQEEAKQITMDHSLLNEMIRQGKIPADTSEADFPYKNAVTRAVGVREFVEVDTFELKVDDGDRFVICSDGLSDYLDESSPLLELMGGDDPQETTTVCIDHANQSGGKDNITVIVIDCELPDLDQAEEAARVIEILRNTAYFHYLSQPELEHIRKLASRTDYAAEEMLLEAEESNDKLFILLKGSVSLQLEGKHLSVLTTGEHFGEMALIDAQNEQDASLAVQALKPTEVLTIGRDQFTDLLRTAPALAIKLLWNFVQVFADRLQSVPAELRFMPDEWRRAPEAMTDITPPAGSLVFEDDLKRLEENWRDEEEEEPVSPVGAGRSGFARNEKTLRLSPLDYTRPGALDVSAEDEGDEKDSSAGAMVVGVDESLFQAKTATVQFNRDRDEESSAERARKGILSGTYDSSILASGSLFDEESDPEEESATSGAEPGQLVIGGNNEEDEVVDLSKTVDLDVDLEQLRSLRNQTPDALKEKIRQRLKERAAPRAEVLKKASTKIPELPPQATQEDSSPGPSVTSGESRVEAAPEQPPPVPAAARPKVMISPDLVVKTDDD